MPPAPQPQRAVPCILCDPPNAVGMCRYPGNCQGVANGEKTMTFAVNQIVTGTALKKQYDAYFLRLLRDYLEPQPRQRKEHAKFKITKPLLSKDDYFALRDKMYTVSVDGLIEDAYDTITELAEEMQEAFDNMPESLQNGDVGQRRQQAADALGDFSVPDIPAEAGDIEVLFLHRLDLSSRSKRAAEAAEKLGGCTRNHSGVRYRRGRGAAGRSGRSGRSTGKLDAAELEGVEFPGMYGQNRQASNVA